jgi:2'-5' RNA ligase
VNEVENVVRGAAEATAVSLITASGFGHFNNTAIYLDIHAPKEAKDTIISLTSALKKIEWLPFEKYDHDVTLHASIARLNWHGKHREKFDDIWKYLKSLPEPAFDLPFDHFAIMQKSDSEPWSERARFKFPK